jgi:hypothetical protein
LTISIEKNYFSKINHKAKKPTISVALYELGDASKMVHNSQQFFSSQGTLVRKKSTEIINQIMQVSFDHLTSYYCYRYILYLSDDQFQCQPDRGIITTLRKKVQEQPINPTPANILSESEKYIHTMADNENIDTMLDGRKSISWQDYIKCGYKGSVATVKENRLQRTLLYAESLNHLTPFNNQEKGMEFNQNSWFMGPYYSFDTNFKYLYILCKLYYKWAKSCT